MKDLKETMDTIQDIPAEKIILEIDPTNAESSNFASLLVFFKNHPELVSPFYYATNYLKNQSDEEDF